MITYEDIKKTKLLRHILKRLIYNMPVRGAYSGAAEPPVRCGVSHVSVPDGATLLELM